MHKILRTYIHCIAHIHAHIHARMQVSRAYAIHASMYANINAYTMCRINFAYMHARMHIYLTRANAHIHACMRCRHNCIHMRMHAYVLADMHTYTHECTPASHAYMQARIYRAQMHTLTQICTHAPTHLCTNRCTPTRVHTYMNACITYQGPCVHRMNINMHARVQATYMQHKHNQFTTQARTMNPLIHAHATSRPTTPRHIALQCVIACMDCFHASMQTCLHTCTHIHAHITCIHVGLYAYIVALQPYMHISHRTHTCPNA